MILHGDDSAKLRHKKIACKGDSMMKMASNG